MTAAEAYRVVEEIWIGAPPERVFRALTEPEEIAAWWRVPGAYETTSASLDLRPGGPYRFTGTSAGRGTFEVTGEMRAVEPSSLLEYTWNPDWDPAAAGSVVRFRLEPTRGGTRLVLEHTGFPVERPRDEHRAGWPAVLASLRTRVEEGQPALGGPSAP